MTDKPLPAPRRLAPDGPGDTPFWSRSTKDGVGTAQDSHSRVWFTVADGIVNEVYYPNADTANMRELGLVVTGPDGFFSREKSDTRHEIFPLAPELSGVPGYRMVNTCVHGRYRITKILFTHPHRDSLLQKITFEALQGAHEDYRLYAIWSPRAGNQGRNNHGTVSDYKGEPMLFAYREGSNWMALACSAGWRARSVGYHGCASDGGQDLHSHGRLTEHYDEAGPGHVILTGEIDLSAADTDGAFVLTLGFGLTQAESGLQARNTLFTSFDFLQHAYVQDWMALQKRCPPLTGPWQGAFDLYRAGIAALAAHEDKRFRGGFIASLSTPWGEVKTDTEEIGYHGVWPRDQVETAGAKLATGLVDNARLTLLYLMCTQDADGRWPQNMWLDGSPHLKAVQMDEIAFPILLVDLLRRKGGTEEPLEYDPWPMVRRAAGFLVRNGPVTEQDRWEINEGFSLFALSSTIAALLVAAEMADEQGEPGLASYLRETADCWNAHIETWIYVRNTPLARKYDVTGYYVWIAPSNVAETGAEQMGTIPLKHSALMPSDTTDLPAWEIVSPDVLALVRFGLRDPNDPRIQHTLHVVDAILRYETDTGPAWRRYIYDGYGERDEGNPYSGEGSGIGRCWPLLAGERAHYELARGNRAEAQRLLEAMGRQTSAGGLLPEQIWDAEDIPEKRLFNGRPSGSAMPLVWAHAEFLKLIRSLHDGEVFDRPPQTVARYGSGASTEISRLTPWRENLQTRYLPQGRRLRIETLTPQTVHWQIDSSTLRGEARTQDTGVGVFVADLPTEDLPAGSKVRFSPRGDGETGGREPFRVEIITE